MNKHIKKIVIFLLVAIVIIGGIISVSADNVIIEQSEGFLELSHANIGESGGTHSAGGAVWPSKGSLSQGNGEYTLTSNGYAQWYDFDGLGFAYKEVYFNYGKKAKLTFEGTLLSFDGEVTNSAAGLMLRSSLSPDAATLMIHIRPGHVMATYRRATKENAKTANKLVETTRDGITAMLPMSFKIEIQGGTATYYYKPIGTDTWGRGYSVPFEYTGDSVYIGLSCYSQDEDFMSTSKWKDFSYQVEAPEGTEPGAPGGSDEEDATEAQVVLPPDLPITSNDILMRETFTDGSMTAYNNPEGVETPDNPVWEIKGINYAIKTNGDETDRYLALEYADPETAFFAGSRDWTDYRFQTEITFTEGTALTETNNMYFYIRHTDYPHYGYENYTVSFMELNIGGQKVRGVRLSSRISNSNTGGGSVHIIQQEFDYLADLGTPHTIAIEALDNTITVYWDGQVLLSYADLGNDRQDMLAGSNGTGYEVKTTGCIGFSGDGVCVNMDDILVCKLEDPLGGDYDNIIGGNWDMPIPEDFLDDYTDLPYYTKKEE